MQRISGLVFLVLLTLSHVHSKNHWNDLIPKGKELDYRYEATVRAGMQLPDAYSSMFDMRATLHVQAGSENDILLRLSDVNYTLDNGRESDFPEKTPIGISDHLMTLTKPFRIVYDNEGKFQEMGVEENEPDYVLNIKKALASLFQVDWRGVRLDSVKVHSFTNKEAGLHGNEENLYNVIPSSKTLRVEKMHHMKSSNHLYHHIVTNVNLFHCDDEFEDPLSHDSQKVYIVDKTQNVLKKIENTGGVYYHPYQTVPPAYNVHVTQSLEMIDMHDIQGTLLIEKETRLKSLEFLFTDSNMSVGIILDKEPLVATAQRLIEEILLFVKTRKIDMSMPDFNRGQLPIRLHYILKHFDMPMLETLLNLLLQKDNKQIMLFNQILPQIGTQTSIKFLIRLIREKKMSDVLAIKALQKMPSFILPNEQIITEAEVLLQLDGVSSAVQKSAILSFASLLQRAQKGHLNHRTLIPDEITEKYIKLLVDKLKSVSSKDEKYLYLHALFNIKSPIVVKYLRGAINGEWWNDNDLRLKAMLLLNPLMIQNQDILNELYWPILTDRSLPSEMRIIAFHIIMLSRPSLSSLINIYWFMQSETDVDLYQFYYTSLESLANTKNPCDRQIKLRATQMLKYMPISYKHSLTHHRKVDLVNTEINTSEYYDMILIDTNEALLFRFEVGKTLMNMHLKPYTFYMRISGLRGKLLKDIQLNMKKQMKLFNYEEVIQNLINLPKMENVNIELVLMKHGQIVFADLIDKSNYDAKKLSYMEVLKEHLKEDMITLDTDLLYRIIIPLDIGFPLMPTAQMPVIKQMPMKTKVDHNNNIMSLNVDAKLKEMIFYVNGLYVHNPIARTWQGVAKLTSYDVALPLNFDLSVNPQQDMLKISWKKSKNPDDNIWVERSYVTHQVESINYGNDELLKKFNPTTDNVVNVPMNPELRNNYTLREVEDLNTGLTTRIEILDTEDTKSVDEISELPIFAMDTTSLIEHSLKHLQFNDDLLMDMLRYSNMEANLILMHKHSIRGVYIVSEPSKTNPVTTVDLSVRLNQEITKEEPSTLHTGMKINLKGTFSLKKEEDLIKRWDANLNWELNNGHTQNNLKAQITRTVPGQTDYKICVEGLETYSEIGITGNLNILMSSSPEGTCTTDETSIVMTMRGERLQDQLKNRNNFPSCRQQISCGIRNMLSFSCLTDRTSIRKYEVDIISKNVPEQLQSRIESFLEFLKVKYYDHFSQDTSNESDKDKTRILLTYPVSNDVLDMEMLRNNRHYKLRALPAVNFRRYGLFTPDNLYYSNIRKMIHRIGLVHTCSADTVNIMNVNNTMLPNVVTEDWIAVVANAPENPDTGLYIKRMDNKLAIKLVQRMRILLVLPVGNTFTLTLDGKTIANEPLLSNEWVTLMTERNYLAILMNSCGTQILYNVNEMFIEVPRYKMTLHGRCTKRD